MAFSVNSYIRENTGIQGKFWIHHVCKYLYTFFLFPVEKYWLMLKFFPERRFYIWQQNAASRASCSQTLYVYFPARRYVEKKKHRDL